jgi:hypothetical protein
VRAPTAIRLEAPGPIDVSRPSNPRALPTAADPRAERTHGVLEELGGLCRRGRLAAARNKATWHPFLGGAERTHGDLDKTG